MKFYKLRCEECGRIFHIVTPDDKQPEQKICMDCIMERSKKNILRFSLGVEEGEEELTTIKLFMGFRNDPFQEIKRLGEI